MKLPLFAQNRLESGDISFGHAKAILALRDPHEMDQAVSLVLSKGLSVRQMEAWVQAQLNPERTEKAPKPETYEDPNVREVREQLQRSLGLKVTIDDHKGRGKVIIEYAKLEDFDTLLEQLAGKSS